MRNIQARHLWAIIWIVAFAACLPARVMAVGSIILSDAWVPALTVQDGTAVIFLTITDLGGPDDLVGVSSPVAAGGDLRKAQMVDGVLRADPIGSVPVTPDEPTTLVPGGRQVILLTGMQERLEEGKHFPLTLTFRKAGPVRTTVFVRRADYADSPGTIR